MIHIDSATLVDYMERILAAAGTPADIAAVVAATLVDADLKGVESHGILRVPHYLELIERDYIKPGARPDLIRDAPALSVMDSNQGFGHFALRELCERTAAKAKATGIAFGGLINTTHTGRIGWFAERIAERGLAIQIMGGGSHRLPEHTAVAPFGGADRTLGTNPLTLGWPGGRFGPIVADFSTSATAEGKVRFHREKGQALPPDWIVDRDGHPSTDPRDLYAGGAIMPMGGHKGYGMALFNEFLGGVMLGPTYEANWSVIIIDVGAFADPESVRADAESLLARIKRSRPMPGHDAVLVPGEPETRTARRRSRDGIPITPSIWNRIRDAAAALGVEM